MYTILGGAVSTIRLVHVDGSTSDLCVKGPLKVTEEIARGWLTPAGTDGRLRPPTT